MSSWKEVAAMLRQYTVPEVVGALMDELQRSVRLGMVLTLYRDQGRLKLNVETMPEATDPNLWEEVLYQYPIDMESLKVPEKARTVCLKVRFENRVRITALTYARNERRERQSIAAEGKGPGAEAGEGGGNDGSDRKPDGETIH